MRLTRSTHQFGTPHPTHLFSVCQSYSPTRIDVLYMTLQEFACPLGPLRNPTAQPRSSAQPTPPKVEAKPPEQKKEGKGNGKGKRGRSESRPEKRKQQCIYFYRGTCQRGDQCRYEHQVGDDGQPVQKFSRNLRMLSRGTVRLVPKPNRNQLLVEESLRQ